MQRDLSLIFLMHYRWNRDKLIERYFESPSRVLSDVGEPAGDEEKQALKCEFGTSTGITRANTNGISGTSSDPPRKRQRRAPSPTAPNICGVCFDEIAEPSEIPRIKCKHIFCQDCWSSYLEHNIKSEGQCMIRCMGEKCKVLVPESFIKDHTEEDVCDRLLLRYSL